MMFWTTSSKPVQVDVNNLHIPFPSRRFVKAECNGTSGTWQYNGICTDYGWYGPEPIMVDISMVVEASIAGLQCEKLSVAL